MDKYRILCRKQTGMQFSTILYFVINILFLIPAGANPWYVASSGGDGNAGTSWASPFATINHAVSEAGDGHVIYVTNNATYTLADTITVTDDIVVRSWKGPGGETDRYTTIINGAGQHRCFYLNNADAVIDGFTITNGFFSDVSGRGAGVWMNGGTVTNCWIVGNRLEASAIQHGGAGVYMAGGSVWNSRITGNVLTDSPPDIVTHREAGGGVLINRTGLVANCEISGNFNYNAGTIPRGGAGVMFNNGGVVQDSVISNNMSLGRGGGVYLIGAGKLVRCVIVDNVSSNDNGGGVWTYCHVDGGGNDILIEDCVISNNIAAGTGGGIYMWGRLSNHVLSGGKIVNNRAGFDGGGVWIRGDAGGSNNTVLKNSVITGNRAGRYGGGVCINAEIPNMFNCLVAGNIAEGIYGGGIYAQSDYAGMISGCTVADNAIESTSSTRRGAGVAIYTSRVYNCVIWSNRWSSGAPGDHERDLGFVSDGAAASNSIHYTCSPRDFSSARGNITNHPSFDNFATANYRLRANSPCVNAGTNQNWMTNAVDLDGYPRIDRHNRRVDMGCYERVTRGTIYSFW